MASRSADGALSAAGVLLVGIYDWPGRRLRIAGARSETASLAGKSRDASAGSHQARLQPAFGRGDSNERHPQASRAGVGPAATAPADAAGKAGDILNAPANALNAPAVQDPIVAPPIYGSTYPPKERVDVSATPQHWVNDLNLDPRDRIAASLGVRIVQEDQEHLIASAWQQVDAIEKENEKRWRKQLATTHTAIHVPPPPADSDDGLLQVTGLSLAKVAVSAWTVDRPPFSAPSPGN